MKLNSFTARRGLNPVSLAVGNKVQALLETKPNSTVETPKVLCLSDPPVWTIAAEEEPQVAGWYLVRFGTSPIEVMRYFYGRDSGGWSISLEDWGRQNTAIGTLRRMSQIESDWESPFWPRKLFNDNSPFRGIYSGQWSPTGFPDWFIAAYNLSKELP